MQKNPQRAKWMRAIMGWESLEEVTAIGAVDSRQDIRAVRARHAVPSKPST